MADDTSLLYDTEGVLVNLCNYKDFLLFYLNVTGQAVQTDLAGLAPVLV